MSHLRPTPTTPFILRRRMATEHFKVCPLCGALNVVENEECFVCRWHNGFDDNPIVVETKLWEMIHECPDLIEVMNEVTPPRQGVFVRLRTWWKSLFGRLDLHA